MVWTIVEKSRRVLVATAHKLHKIIGFLWKIMLMVYSKWYNSYLDFFNAFRVAQNLYICIANKINKKKEKTRNKIVIIIQCLYVALPDFDEGEKVIRYIMFAREKNPFWVFIRIAPYKCAKCVRGEIGKRSLSYGSGVAFSFARDAGLSFRPFRHIVRIGNVACTIFKFFRFFFWFCLLCMIFVVT